MFPVTNVTGLCRTIVNLNTPNPLLFNPILTSNSIDFLPSPPNDFPTFSNFKRNIKWICRQSPVYSIVDLIHKFWLSPGAGTFELLLSVCVCLCVCLCLLPGFVHVDECRVQPLPRQVQAVRAGDGFADEDADGPLEPWHMFARRQQVRGGPAVVLALREGVTRLSYPAFIPARGWGAWVRYLRQFMAAELHQQLFEADAGTRAVFGLWALCVDPALRHEDRVAAIGN